jgi:NTP pyrophosphatase (non-canonical NTP hydrolase)
MTDIANFDDKQVFISLLKRMVKDFVEERNWGKYHNSKDIAISIALEAAELMELFQWKGQQEVLDMLKNQEKLVRVKEELADIMILCLNMANVLDVDVSQAIAEKIDKNKAKYPVELVKGNYRKYTELKKQSRVR